jgi:hypothetical protein
MTVFLADVSEHFLAWIKQSKRLILEFSRPVAEQFLKASVAADERPFTHAADTDRGAMENEFVLNSGVADRRLSGLDSVI